uniref:ATP synthase complex subunit 8 n=1 Tax=Torpedo marmorata TaxID=7788 RepID=A0A8A6NLQ4_TORMA|nr:ATP synthase F0 subunit 8 [Torpedo marmorata]QTJ25403.1 ATP synthase F0 subunit 8 [Torpedo marmorata]
MPQLNPNPWFLIFIFSWFFFLFVMTQKVLSYLFNKEPMLKNAEKPKPEPWNWPWT